ncbi:extracellular solute-binding protein [Leucobacter coleopterorum]|uniref:Extracellular solute-binding protein n=1 Tax=Leucobacter coleopterorum TaxID=2714933 RepID=A0ABX6JZK5_9MICO|nr:extracellular solute-binding protein [Leucobacter coleopterorum]QIM18200.1 extracellular solute-binding protein [Leucobacter coleopterorum]
MKLSHAITSSIGIVATALLLAGCSGGDSAAETSKAVMYTSNNETTVGVVTSAAAASDPSLKVEAVTGSSGPLLQRIKSEASAPAADVFYSAPATTFADFSEFAEPYRSPEADAIPADLLDAEDRWVPTNTHVVALMANTDQIDGGKAPTSWKDLTDPKWKGKVIVADPSQSSTALTALYGASKVLGENDFTKLVENLEVTENSSNVYPAVAQGEYAVAIAYESNIYPYVAGEQAGIEMVYPRTAPSLSTIRHLL